MGHRRDGGKLQCETRALPAPLEQEKDRKEPAECTSLGKHSWMEPPDPQEMRLCEIIHCRIVLGAQGESGDLCRISVCNPLLTVLLPQRLLRALLAPLHPRIHGGQQAQPKRAPIQAEV